MEAATTPMLKQYQTFKKQYPDSILFFRLGDFYEMFYEDALTASPILNVVLTSRDSGKSGRIPMCGIPYHARQNYITKLIKAGHKVAICEQVEDPAKAQGLVERDVIRVITSGTYIDENSYETRCLAALLPDGKETGIAVLDITSGAIQANQYNSAEKVLDILSRNPVFELIYSGPDKAQIEKLLKQPSLNSRHICLSAAEEWLFNREMSKKSLCEHFGTQNLRGFGLDELPLAAAAAGALLEYARQANRMPLRHITKLSLYTDTDCVFISPAAVYGLGLEELFKTIDRTLTSMGRRLLKTWMHRPLKNTEPILSRQKAVSVLKNNPLVLEQLRGLLHHLPDIEKSISRIGCNDASARDLLALRSCLLRVPDIKLLLDPLCADNPLLGLDDIPELRTLLEKAVNPDTPLSNPHGKIIRSGYDSRMDETRDLQENARGLLKELQAREIQRTGINSLKIGYTSVFGYYLEITKANLKSIPGDYIRKQTLVNAERFITPELKDYEEKMLNAETRLFSLEQEITAALNKSILDEAQTLNTLAAQIATLDCLYSLATLALSAGYCAPRITEDMTIRIEDGRHPVVESFLNEPFIPNDTLLDDTDNHLIILTGPNMSGKSTYIRQTAILVIMAQMGSFIPARAASIGLADKIFTRIGAHDEIAKGQSTFMVEMSETAGIVNNLTPRSLVILDEIGRGTSTYDGLSLAWALAEHLNRMKTRTLFATHFHELMALAEDHPGIRNFNVSVKEWNDEVIFLHKIVPGGTDDSYGIYVAKLAGIPQEVIKRAQEILMRLELSGKLHDKIRHTGRSSEDQLSFMLNKEDASLRTIKEELTKLDLNTLTPIELMNKVQQWKEYIYSPRK